MWLDYLQINPLPSLSAWDDAALKYLVQRDLCQQTTHPINGIWETRKVKQLRKKQQPDGSWQYPGKAHDPSTVTNYSLLETYRNLRILVEMYALTVEHPVIEQASHYIFSCQKPEGDIRGILGSQYMPYYHGAILELLIKAELDEDPRVLRGLEWLISLQQKDGGWIVPAQLVSAQHKTESFWLGDPLPPDKTKPHSHMATGMVIRAFAAHPIYRKRPEVIRAGKALKNRLFKADKYNDRKAAPYWLKFQFPFWWTNLLTALDTLYPLGFNIEDDEILKGLDWFLHHQESDGLWPTGYGSGKRAQENRYWVGFAICRVLNHYLNH